MHDHRNRARNHLIATFIALLSVVQLIHSQSRDAADVSALMRAARDGERENVQALLQQGVDINVKDASGWTALIYAAAKGDAAIVKALLDRSADINAKDTAGYTALQAAAQYGNTAAAKLLLEKGADINAKTNSGMTALMMAIGSGDSGLIKYLISKGADVNAAAEDGTTALTSAMRMKHMSIADLLRKSGGIESAATAAERTTNSPAQITRPSPLNNPEPSYTTKAQQRAVEGIVYVRILVGQDGAVKKVRVLRGLPYGLSYQATDAAFQLRFKPATKDGQPVEFWQTVQIEFHLRR
jgi:uncharacterized protein